ILGPRSFAPAPQDQGDHSIVSAFIAGLVERDPQGFEYLETVVKGSMLASSLYLGDLGAVNQRFQQVTVYFDTPFLLDALGYAGKEIAQPALELLGLVRELGARLACFGHGHRAPRGAGRDRQRAAEPPPARSGEGER